MLDNGKVFVAGYAGNNGKYNFTLAKYNEDGSFDNTFNDSGKVVTSLTANDDFGGPFVIQPDGKIVLGGFTQTAEFNADLAIVRYNADGTLDNSFGNNGIIISDLGGGNDVIHDITLQPDGKILASGYSIVQFEGARAMILRYNTNGTLDQSFGTNGVVYSNISQIVAFSSGVSVAYGIRVQSDGKIVTGGTYTEPGNQIRAYVARYNANGNFDTSFDNDGVVSLNYNVLSNVDKLDIQPDGKIVTVGNAGTGLTRTLELTRLNSNGSFDQSFGTNGKVSTSFDNAGAFGKGVTVLTNRILVAGHTSDASGDSKFISVRYNTDGSLDAGFGTSGKVMMDFGFNKNVANGISVNSSGAFVLGGFTSTLTAVDEDFAIAKFIGTVGLPVTPPSNGDGTLDTSFGNGGKVTTKLSTGTDFVMATKILDNGKVLAAGYSAKNGKDEFSLVKYNADGSFDIAFGDSGKVFTAVGTISDIATCMVVQPDDKILLGGYSTQPGSTTRIGIVRYNSNGTLDNTFGTGGIVTTQIGTPFSEITKIGIQSDGKIVASGYSSSANNVNKTTVVRYNPNGTLDNTFGTGGIVITDVSNILFSLDAESSSRGLKVLDNGKIVCGVNYIIPGGQIRTGVVRYHSDGSLDNSFNGNGISSTNFGVTTYNYSLDVQPDGKIVTIGEHYEAGDLSFAVSRHNSDGTLDQSFGTDGKVITGFGSLNSVGRDVVILDEKILAAGFAMGKTGTNFATVRYNYDGTLDEEFGIMGKSLTDFGGTAASVSSLSVHPTGKYVVGGIAVIAGDGDYAMAKYNGSIGLPVLPPSTGDGSLDLSFGDSGKVITELSDMNDVVSAVKVLDNGKVLAAGYAGNNSKLDWALVRYNVDGSLDNTFGDSGKVFTSIGTANDYVSCMVIQPDGKIVLGGYTGISGNNSATAVARYNSNGTLDQSFGTNGIVTKDIDVQSDVIVGISLQSDGKIVVSGSSQTPELRSRALNMRFTSNGTLDSTFGTAGVVITDLSNLIASYQGVSVGRSVKIQNDGKIVAGGSYHIQGNAFRSCVYRLNPDGTLDTSFDGDGIATTDFNEVTTMFSIDIQPNGKIVTFGQSGSIASQSLVLTRHNTNGSLDQTFGTNGKVVTTFSNETPYARELIVLKDKLLAAGYINNTGTGFSKFAAVRYNYDGSLDESFGTGGKISTDFPSANINVANAVGVQSNGSFVIGGYVARESGVAFALAKYNGTALIPVELASFSASVGEHSVALSWTTITELNNAGFEIERKLGDITETGEFSTVAYVKGNGTTQNITTYTYTDVPSRAGTYTYRLKQIDLNGEFSYSAPLAVSFNTNLITNYSLSQNYPNPFNPSTVINFTIPVKSHANLRVYDITGAEIATLVNSELNPGVYNINFTANGLSSGVYFYRLQAGDFMETKKMLITK
ncbi:MAG: T9SS type A sorting domain-containing protein [Ignavibacteriaceae bacterium]|nr:T9SS type A sorting domain-containing protein [Ignavibacteriaceae bacterium]